MLLMPNFYQVGSENLSHRFDGTAYLLRGDDYSILVDCGTPLGYQKIVQNIKSCGVNPSDIRYILGTHGHYDHVGAASDFKRDYGCKLLLHKNDVERVESGDKLKTASAVLYGEDFVPVKVDTQLNGGEHFTVGEFRIEAIHTPGHTPGGVCYEVEVNGLKLLIAGDTINGGFSKHIDSNEEDWKRSLDILCSRHYDMMVVGHSNATLLCDADDRLKDARNSFANYYNPWFKRFDQKYKY